MSKNILGGCALASDDRSFKEICHIQGLPSDYDLPNFNVKGKKKVVGNGVPLSMGRVIALAVKAVTVPGQTNVTLQQNKSVTVWEEKRCACGCGRVLVGKQKYNSPRCRKNAQRQREKSILGDEKKI